VQEVKVILICFFQAVEAKAAGSSCVSRDGKPFCRWKQTSDMFVNFFGADARLDSTSRVKILIVFQQYYYKFLTICIKNQMLLISELIFNSKSENFKQKCSKFIEKRVHFMN